MSPKGYAGMGLVASVLGLTFAAYSSVDYAQHLDRHLHHQARLPVQDMRGHLPVVDAPRGGCVLRVARAARRKWSGEPWEMGPSAAVASRAWRVHPLAVTGLCVGSTRSAELPEGLWQ